MKGRQSIMLSAIAFGVSMISLTIIEKNAMLSLILDTILLLVILFTLYYTHKELDEYIITKTKIELQGSNEESKEDLEKIEDEYEKDDKEKSKLSKTAYKLHKISYVLNIVLLIVISILIGVVMSKLK